MAAPVDDSYSVASGAGIYGGKYNWPAWRRSIAAQHWGVVPSNTLASIDPEDNPAYNPNYPSSAPWHGSVGLASVISKWCGACYDQDNDVLWLPLGGGHGDYAGNEPYKINLDADTCNWEMVRNPTGAIGNIGTLNDGQEATGVYFDGRPRSVHSYCKPVYIPNIGPAMGLMGASYSAGNAGALKPAIINPTTGEVSLFGSVDPHITLPESSGSGHCYDPTRHCIWVVSSAVKKVHYYDIAMNSWVYPGVSIQGGAYSAVEYLPGHDCLLILNSGLSNGFRIYDCTSHTVYNPGSSGALVGITTLGGTMQPRWSGDNTVAIWDNSTNTTEINTLSFASNPRTDAWVIAQLTVSGSNLVTPTAKTSNGTYGRFFYSPNLDGFGVINSVTEQIFFYARS